MRAGSGRAARRRTRLQTLLVERQRPTRCSALRIGATGIRPACLRTTRPQELESRVEALHPDSGAGRAGLLAVERDLAEARRRRAVDQWNCVRGHLPTDNM